MMKRNLEDYAIKFENLLDKQTCIDAIEQQKNMRQEVVTKNYQ